MSCKRCCTSSIMISLRALACQWTAGARCIRAIAKAIKMALLLRAFAPPRDIIGSGNFSRKGADAQRSKTRLLGLESSMHWQRLTIAVFILLCGNVSGAEPPRITRDLEYARVGDISLKLDLYVPAAAKSPPVVVWVHGGAWRGGSKSNPSVLPLTERGYAVASVDYRLSPVAKFPAQVYDIKAALRYLRATAKQHGINEEKIAISGGSAGGHLAALVGATN